MFLGEKAESTYPCLVYDPHDHHARIMIVIYYRDSCFAYFRPLHKFSLPHFRILDILERSFVYFFSKFDMSITS